MMDRAQWRNYRGYSIVKGRTLGLARYSVWHGGHRLGIFASGIGAELFVDELSAAPAPVDAPLH